MTQVFIEMNRKINNRINKKTAHELSKLTTEIQDVPGSFRFSSPELLYIFLRTITFCCCKLMRRTVSWRGRMMPPAPPINMSQPPRSGVRSIPSVRSLPGACGVKDDGRLRPHSEPLLSPESLSKDKRHRWQRWVLSRTRTLTRLWFVLRLFSSSSLIAADI